MTQEHRNWMHRTADWLEARWSEVRLPHGVEPRFEPSCIRCGSPAHTSVEIRARGYSSRRVLEGSLPRRFGLLVRPAVRLPAPVCDTCAPQVRFASTWRRRIYFLPVVAMAVAYPVGLFSQASWVGWVFPLGLSTSALWIFWEVLFPEALAITVTDEELRFEFASRERGASFARANGSELK